MLSFNDDADKPVSSVFTAPIPSSSSLVTPKSLPQQGSHISSSATSPSPLSRLIGQTSSRTSHESEGALLSTHESTDASVVMASMSQRAIDELVESAFEHGDVDKDDR